MNAADVATRKREALTEYRPASSLRLVSAHDGFEEIKTCKAMIGRWRHDSIARKMSRCGKRLAPAPTSPAPVETSNADELKEICAILALGIGLGLVFASPAERVINGIASTISPPQVQIAPATPLQVEPARAPPVKTEASPPPTAAPEVATGAATITFDKGAQKIVVPVEINGERARLWLDTGTYQTLLTAEMGKRAHLVAEGAAVEGMGIGGGKSKEKRARAALLSLGGSAIKNARVWVQENPDPMFEGKNVDGLLGLDFLQKFQIRIAGGVIELTPLGAK